MSNQSLPISSSTTGLKRLRSEHGQDRQAGSLLNAQPNCEVRSPDQTSTGKMDRLGLYVIGSICIIGVALVCRIQIAYSPSVWTHFVIALPPMLLACGLPISLLKGWLARSRITSNQREVAGDGTYVRPELRDSTLSAADLGPSSRRAVSN